MYVTKIFNWYFRLVLFFLIYFRNKMKFQLIFQESRLNLIIQYHLENLET